MSLLDIEKLLGEKSLLMVGGKGGVGKTTAASALALRASELGRRVLLVSTDPAHSLADAFDARIGDRETPLAENLAGLEIDPDAEVDAYLERVRRQMARHISPVQRDTLERQLKLSRESPGAQEAALLERISALIDDPGDRDLLIFDTAPTGHTLRLLSLPEIMSVWMEGLLQQNRRSEKLGEVLAHLTPGRDLDSPTAGGDERSRALAEPLLERQGRFRRTRRCLQDNRRSGFIFVLTAERLPILETARAVENLREAKIPVAGLLVNRVLPDGVGEGDFLRARKERELRLLQDIEQRFADLDRRHLPLQPDDIHGLDALRRFSRLLHSP